MVSFPWRMMRKWPCASLIFFAWSLPLFGQQFDGTLRGHEGAILMGVFTPDGQRAVTASADQTARVWDVKTGQMLRRYDQHTGPLYSLAVSQSGHTLVSGSQDNTVRTWDLPSTTPDESLVSAAAAVRGIALHPDGNGLLAVSADKQLSIHNLRTIPRARGEVAKPQPPEVRTGHGSEALTVSIRSDGVAYASADVEGHIHLWNAFLPAPQRTLMGAAARVSAVRFVANNQQLISSGDDGAIRVWQLNTPASRTLPPLTAEVVALDLLTSQSSAVVALADKTMRVINLTDDSVLAQIPPLPFPIRGVTHAPNNTWIAVAGDQSQAAVVNPATGAIQGVVLGHVGEVTAIAAHADNMQFVTTGIDGTIRLWQQPQPETVVAGHTGPVRGIATDPNHQWFATISDDKTSRIWDTNGTIVRQLGSHEQPLRAIAVRDDAALLATGDAGGDVWLSNPADGSPQGVVAAHPGGITGLTFSADRTLLITTGADQKIRAWKLPLPPKKPGEGETPLAPTWESVIPGGRTVSTLLTLPGDLGYAGLQAGVGEVLRLKIDGSDFSPKPTSPRPLKSLQLSSDGQQLLGVDDQGQAFVWNGQGTILKSFPLGPHVTSARFRPDGRELVVLDAQPRLRICDASTGRVNEELTTSAPLTDAVWIANESRHLAGIGPGNSVIVSRRALQRIFVEATDPASPPQTLKPVTAVAMVADQQHLLAARKEGGLEQWRISDGVLVRKFGADSAEIHELSISTNGQLVAGIGAYQKLHIWTWGDGKLSQTIDLPAPGRSLTISPDNSRVATGHSDGKLRVWDLVTGRLLETFEGHAAGAAVARFLSDSRTLVSGSADKTVRVNPCAATHSFRVAPEALPPIALYNGGTHALTGRSTGEVVMVDLNTGMETRLFRVKVPQPPVAATEAPPVSTAPGPYALFQPTTLASRSDNQRVAAGTRTGEVFLWNANNGDDLLAKFPLGAAVSTLAFSPDNQKLAATTVDGKVRIYGPSIPGAQPALEWTQWQEFQTASPVTDLAFTPDSRSVWVSLESGAVERWAISAPGPVRQFNHGGPVYGTAVSWDGQTIVSCSADQTVRVWDNKTGQQKYQLNGHEGPVHAVTMSLDETFAVSSGADGTLRLWDIAGGRQLKELARYDSTMYSVAIHPQGQLVATAGADRRVHLLDLNAGAEVRTLEGHKDYLHSVQFSPDGAKLASFGYAGHLKIWRTADGALLHESRQGNVGNYAAFSPDGTKLLLSGGDGLARILVVP